MKTLRYIPLVLAMALFISVAHAVLPKDIVFVMTFDEGRGETVDDLSGNSNNGEVNGKADWIDGEYEGAFHLDGATNITVPNAEPLASLKHPMSVGAWVNPDVLGGWRNIAEMDGAAGWKLGFHDSRAIVWTTYHVKDFIGQTVIEEGEWTHVVATWDGAEAIIYVNGEEDKGGPIAGGGVINVKNEPSLDIGYRSTSKSSYFEGGIDELWISNTVKTQAGIEEIMNTGFNAILAVDPQDKLPMTWGKIKSER